MSNPQILPILRSFVADVPPAPGEALDIPALWQCAVQQNLLPILAYQNKRRRLFPDEAVNQRLDAILYGTVAGNINRCIDFETLSAHLTSQGIAHMPVKGYYLRKLYPLPELRTFGDIDMLIHPADREKTDRLMNSLGYTVDHDWEPTYSYGKGTEFYEIHTNLMDGNLDNRADLLAYFAGAWQHALPDEGLRYAPAQEFHFLYTVCHLAKHLYGGGAGLRMYLDIALYIRRCDAGLDWDTIAKEFATLHLTGFFHTVMNAARLWFGVETRCPLPEPDEETLAHLLAYTLDSDLFGHSRDHAVVNLRNRETPSKGRLLQRMLFPSAGEIEQRYTFLQNRHWLLPAAWVARLFANGKLIPRRIRDMRSVSKAKKTDVSTYDHFMKKIGL